MELDNTFDKKIDYIEGYINKLEIQLEKKDEEIDRLKKSLHLWKNGILVREKGEMNNE